MVFIPNNEIKRKIAKPTHECLEMLAKALDYIEENSSTQAEVMLIKFNEIINLLETFPGIGTKHKNKMRKFPLGKFPYFIYYREKQNEIEILGIWHTSRGSEFEE